MNYGQFILNKSQVINGYGFEPLWLPDFAFDFQKSLLTFALTKGRAAIFADCGLGKSPMELIWAQNVVMKTNGRVLIVMPLAVSQQMVREAAKFGVDVFHSRDGKLSGKIIITNYERLHYFNHGDFVGMACDESSILKNFDGATKAAITEFMRKLQYRSLWTATAAPNDYIELGTSSEAIGELGYVDMLKMFFKASDNSYATGGSGSSTAKRFNKNPFGGKFRFRGHAESQFWRWVCSWARAVRKPSDLGFDDTQFRLPKLTTNQHIIASKSTPAGFLFPLEAHGLKEQRDERRRTIQERCEKAAELANAEKSATVSWCNLNPEGKLLARLIKDAVEICGSDSDERKEEVFAAFSEGKIKKLVTKKSIAGFGLNWQHCHHQTYFPDHSFEGWYQCVRRSWRFGQKRGVKIDVVTSEGESSILKNLERKSAQAEEMFSQLVSLMNNELHLEKLNPYTQPETIPQWL